MNEKPHNMRHLVIDTTAPDLLRHVNGGMRLMMSWDYMARKTRLELVIDDYGQAWCIYDPWRDSETNEEYMQE